MPYSREKTSSISLDLHASSSSVTSLSTTQVGINDRAINRETGGQPFYNHCQAGSVRLARCKKAKHQKLLIDIVAFLPGWLLRIQNHTILLVA